MEKNMDPVFSSLGGLLQYWWLAVIVAMVLGYKWTFRLFGVYIIPDDQIGLVIKKFVLFGRNKELPAGKIVALQGEAGIQAGTLAPGLHIGLWPWQFDVKYENLFIVPPGNIGVIESCDGKPLPDGRVLACNVDCDNFQDAHKFLSTGGERGAQTAIIPPGAWRINTLVFTVKVAPMAIIEPGKIGVVEARDGKALSSGRIIGRHVECDSFQDAAAFMNNGGERGPQMSIIPQGQYRINPRLFKVEMVDITDIPDNMVGIVTTKEGKPLNTGDIAGPEIAGHNMFQNPMSFVENGGTKGLQEQVLLAGRYFINPKFAVVQSVHMTEVPIASVGVVVAFVGKQGEDVTGIAFKHANMVRKGERGVWVDVLDPGKYPINPFTHKVSVVPTANVVLNWATGKTEAHKLDANLSTIVVRSGDGFSFNLDVSQIIHIPRNDAPKVIARFGSMEALVTQVLEPTIGNYFRNAAQSSDVIEFLKKRSERQQEAKTAIAAALHEYDVGAVETLIGDIVPPAELMKTLTDRKIAEQEQVTYETQRLAQITRKELQQATAQADTQASVVAAERSVEIADFSAKAVVKKASGEADAKKINAAADAQVLTVVGEAEGKKINAVGTAEAAVIQLKTNAVGQENYRLIESVKALAEAKIPLVPQIVAGASSGSGSSSFVEILMANLVQSNLAAKALPVMAAPAVPSATAPTAESRKPAA
jgi:uncharacterized membrane protein YqiK